MKKLPVIIIVVAVLSLVWTFSVQASGAGWPVFHGNTARTGNVDSGIPREPKLIWQLNVKDLKEKGIDPRGINRPIIYNNKVFISATEVIGLDLNTGGFLWRHKENNLYPSNLAAGDGKVFAVFNDSTLLKSMSQGFIYALDGLTGNFLWKYQTQKPVSHSTPLFEAGKVFVGDDSGSIYALNSKTGKLVWKKFLDAEVIHSSPSFYKGIVFIGTEGTGRSNALPSRLFALDAETGNIIWKFQIDFILGKANLVHGTPAILDGVVYFGSENGYFYALAYDSGKLIWKKKIASGDKFLAGVSAPPVLSEGKIFITTWEGELFSLNQKDGEIVWQKTFDKSSQGGDAVAIAGNSLVCITVNEKFSCLNHKSGETAWEKEFFGGTPAAASGFLVIPNMGIADGSPDNMAVIFTFSDKSTTTAFDQTASVFSFDNRNFQIAIASILGVVLATACYKLLKSRKISIKQLLIYGGIPLALVIGGYVIYLNYTGLKRTEIQDTLVKEGKIDQSTGSFIENDSSPKHVEYRGGKYFLDGGFCAGSNAQRFPVSVKRVNGAAGAEGEDGNTMYAIGSKDTPEYIDSSKVSDAKKDCWKKEAQ